MKLSKKLFAAAATLGLAAAATVGSTYAWFSLNDTVAVTGMTATTKTENNLFVSATTTESDFDVSLNQTVAAKLRPVSTVNAESFFYTVAAKGNGAIKAGENYVAYNETTSQSDTGAKKTAYDAAFNTAYKTPTPITTSNVVYGYVDYTFYLKATSANADQKVSLRECKLQYNGGALEAKDLSWRVALFATEGQATAAATDGASKSLISILTLTGAVNQTDGEAVNSTSATAAVTYGTAATVEADIDSGVTKYYKVVVRLWLEGEDTKCTNQTYAELTNAYSLSLQFNIGNDAGIQNITTGA